MRAKMTTKKNITSVNVTTNGPNGMTNATKQTTAPYSPSSRGSAMLKAALDHKQRNTIIHIDSSNTHNNNNDNITTNNNNKKSDMAHTNKNQQHVTKHINHEQASLPPPVALHPQADGQQNYSNNKNNLFVGTTHNDLSYNQRKLNHKFKSKATRHVSYNKLSNAAFSSSMTPQTNIKFFEIPPQVKTPNISTKASNNKVTTIMSGETKTNEPITSIRSERSHNDTAVNNDFQKKHTNSFQSKQNTAIGSPSSSQATTTVTLNDFPYQAGQSPPKISNSVCKRIPPTTPPIHKLSLDDTTPPPSTKTSRESILKIRGTHDRYSTSKLNASASAHKPNRPRSDRVLFTDPVVSNHFEYEPTTYQIEQKYNVEDDSDESDEDILDVILNTQDEGQACKVESLPKYSSASPRRRSLKRPRAQVPHLMDICIENDSSNITNISGVASAIEEGGLFSPPKVAKITPFYHLPGGHKVSGQDIGSDQQRGPYNDINIEDITETDNCNSVCATDTANKSFFYNILACGCSFITSRLYLPEYFRIFDSMDAGLNDAFNGLDLNSNKTKTHQNHHTAQNGSSKPQTQFNDLNASLDTLILQISELENKSQPSHQGITTEVSVQHSAFNMKDKDSLVWINNDLYDLRNKR